MTGWDGTGRTDIGIDRLFSENIILDSKWFLKTEVLLSFKTTLLPNVGMQNSKVRQCFTVYTEGNRLSVLFEITD